MLRKAIATLKSDEKPIVHSDRGCHYRWPEWISIMEEAGLTRSMSKKGCSPDNSACEGFFGHLKTEMFYGHNWDECSIDEFIQVLEDYLHWYCKDRIKSTLGGLSPLDYRRMARNNDVDLTAKQFAVMNMRFTMISGLLPLLDNKPALRQAIKDTAKQYGCSVQTVKNYLTAYQASGCKCIPEQSSKRMIVKYSKDFEGALKEKYCVLVRPADF